jgi:acetate kinase
LLLCRRRWKVQTVANAETARPGFAVIVKGNAMSKKTHLNTSGMKALVHGGVNLSELDGWRAEAYAPEVGWALGDGQEHGDILMDWIQERIERGALAAVGHRVVHGGPKYWEPQRITPEMIGTLQQLSPFDPEHLPEEILLTKAFHRRFPDLPQVACFDTAFHHDMPRVARLLPIPRQYYTKGVQRYGFHGLSCAYLIEELARVAGAEEAQGRVILAHLGNGASMTAVRNCKSIDTSMSFTPTAGLPMSTRAGDLDPGLGWYLARTEQMTAQQFHRMVNHESGLLGVSELSSDVRELLSREATDPRAADAVALSKDRNSCQINHKESTKR